MDEDMREKNGYRKGFLSGVLAAVFIVLAALLVYAVLGIGGELPFLGDSSSAVGSSQTGDKLEKLETLIDLYYLGDVEEEDLVEGMYAGLVSGLDDPYSVYYTEEELDAMMETAAGTYVGIGVTVTQDAQTGQITLLNPTEGGPAYLAGIKSEDILLEVDGEAVTGQDLNTVVSKIKGEEGSSVLLTVQRGSEELQIEVERATIETQTVGYEMMDGQIGYLYILEFDDVTTGQFLEALEELENAGMEKLIIDLRDNPGGNVQVVCDILDRILPEGLIVYTEDKYGEREEYMSDGENYLDCPLVVLINENSASASEIFAGAVKDYGIGTLVGTTSYGKGVVQSILDLGDGTAVKLTVSKYYTPNGNNIDGVGIEPDVEVEIPSEAYEDYVITYEEDTQLQKAQEILQGE